MHRAALRISTPQRYTNACYKICFMTMYARAPHGWTAARVINLYTLDTREGVDQLISNGTNVSGSCMDLHSLIERVLPCVVSFPNHTTMYSISSFFIRNRLIIKDIVIYGFLLVTIRPLHVPKNMARPSPLLDPTRPVCSQPVQDPACYGPPNFRPDPSFRINKIVSNK